MQDFRTAASNQKRACASSWACAASLVEVSAAADSAALRSLLMASRAACNGIKQQ